MKKIKVNKTVGKALNIWFKNEYNAKERLLQNHYIFIHEGHRWSVLYEPLNNLTMLDVANIVTNGYEIELSKEEKVLGKYKDNFEIACTTSHVKDQWYANGFNDGIEYMNNLYELGLKFTEESQ